MKVINVGDDHEVVVPDQSDLIEYEIEGDFVWATPSKTNTLVEWQGYMDRLLVRARKQEFDLCALHFAIGDLWSSGMHQYGEDEVFQSLPDNHPLAQWAVSTIKVDSWIARKIAPERRDYTLSLAIHKSVAALPADEQIYWLGVAKRESLTRRDLNSRIFEHKELEKLPEEVDVKSKTAEEGRHLKSVAALGCIVCLNLDDGYVPAQVHHIREGRGLGQRSGHFLTIPLCPEHHTDGGSGVAFHATGRTSWAKLYGNELKLLDQTLSLLEVERERWTRI